MKKTLIACSCKNLICLSTEAHGDDLGRFGFDPDGDYETWKTYEASEKCPECILTHDYFVNKGELPGENFTTFQRDADRP